MTEPSKYHRDTLAIHGGQAPDSQTRSRAVPIYQTAAYNFESVEAAADLFSQKAFGFTYTRSNNPTTAVLERRLAALDGGTSAVALASGAAAIYMSVLNLACAGQNIVSSSALYGGTWVMFRHRLARLGIEARFVDTSDPAQIEAAIDENTRLVYSESIANPRCRIEDFEAIAEIAHRHRIPYIVDNTVSPWVFRPFEHGVDVAVYSITKYVGGHGTSIGGAIVESGNFDWAASGKFPEFTEPDPSAHGLVLWDLFGSGDQAKIPNSAFIMKARWHQLRDTGPTISPFNSFLFLQGLETLHLRMPRHCENAQAVAEWLLANPYVSWVNYPGLAGHADRPLAEKYMPGGPGAVFGFGIKGGLAAGVRFINALELISHLANIGDAKTLCLHPASTSHQQLSAEERLSTGVTEDLVRLSIGIEDVRDIIADLDQALRASQA